MKYLKKFSNHNGYDGFINTDKFIRPNVSICKQENDVHYNQTLPHDYSNDYFTIKSLEDDNNISIVYSGSMMSLSNYPVYYSKNNGDWTLYSSAINLNTGDTLRLYSNMKEHYYSYTQKEDTYTYYRRYSSTKTCNVYGNIMSLFYQTEFNDKTQFNNLNESKDYKLTCNMFRQLKIVNASNLILPATELIDWCYYSMFQGCTTLTTAPELPATTLADHCYHAMFSGCTALTTVPELPATTLADSCYHWMFSGCKSLTTAPELPATALSYQCYTAMFSGCTNLETAPELPATVLADYCYYYMFRGCTALTTAPVLPATTLASGCYYMMFWGCRSLVTAPELHATTLTANCYDHMFYDCTSLNYIKCLATNISATDCTFSWVTNVAAIGTFVKAASANWSSKTDTNGIPSGWTVQDYVES